MAKRKKAAIETAHAAGPPGELRRTLVKGRTRAEDVAEMMVEGIAQNTLTTQMFSSMLPETDTTEAFALTLSLAERVARCDRSALEAILAAQVITCNSIFTDCVKRARQNYQSIEVHDRLMRIGLRAQNQCRATVESIALMQNPPTVFARQANIANGPQQVNNGLPPERVAGAGGNQSQPNELMGANGERLDRGTPQETGNSDSRLETVEALNRTTNRRR